MAKKVINVKHQVDEVIELDADEQLVRMPYDVVKRPVSKSDLTTPIGTERLHASKPWNKTRLKAIKK